MVARRKQSGLCQLHAGAQRQRSGCAEVNGVPAFAVVILRREPAGGECHPKSPHPPPVSIGLLDQLIHIPLGFVRVRCQIPQQFKELRRLADEKAVIGEPLNSAHGAAFRLTGSNDGNATELLVQKKVGSGMIKFFWSFSGSEPIVRSRNVTLAPVDPGNPSSVSDTGGALPALSCQV